MFSSYSAWSTWASKAKTTFHRLPQLDLLLPLLPLLQLPVFSFRFALFQPLLDPPSFAPISLPHLQHIPDSLQRVIPICVWYTSAWPRLLRSGSSQRYDQGSVMGGSPMNALASLLNSAISWDSTKSQALIKETGYIILKTYSEPAEGDSSTCILRSNVGFTWLIDGVEPWYDLDVEAAFEPHLYPERLALLPGKNLNGELVLVGKIIQPRDVAVALQIIDSLPCCIGVVNGACDCSLAAISRAFKSSSWCRHEGRGDILYLESHSEPNQENVWNKKGNLLLNMSWFISGWILFWQCLTVFIHLVTAPNIGEDDYGTSVLD